MLFNNNQIEELLGYVRFQHALYIGDYIGYDTLTKNDIALLKSYGIDPLIRYANLGLSPAEESFYLGRLAAALGNYQASKIDYNDFKKFVQGGGHSPLTAVERAALDVSKQQSYAAIKNLGSKVGSFITQMANAKSDDIRSAYEEIIRSETEKTIRYRRSLKEMAIEIGKKTGDWQRDLDRVVETEMHNTFEAGKAVEFSSRGGADVLVYKDVYPGACRHCIKHYLTGGIGSEPKIFKLSVMQSYGTNIGKKVQDWKPVVKSMHPYCRCDLREVPNGYKWDKETNSFSIPDASVKRNSKVKRGNIKVRIGEEEYTI